jgi:hypothetical protein
MITDTADHGLAQPSTLGHCARAPVRRIGGSALQGQPHHPLNLCVADLTRRPGTRFVQQSVQPRSTKRWRHLSTVWWVIPSFCASACALLGRRAQRSSVSRSSTVRLNGAIGRPVRISLPPHVGETLADHILFNLFRTQDTLVIFSFLRKIETKSRS